MSYGKIEKARCVFSYILMLIDSIFIIILTVMLHSSLQYICQLSYITRCHSSMWI